MNTNNLILIIVILLLIYYLYNKYNNKYNNKHNNNLKDSKHNNNLKDSKHNNNLKDSKHNNNLKGGNTNRLEIIYNPTIRIENTTPVTNAEFDYRNFNYNNFKLEFTLGREKGLLIKDLKGGIMTISTNPKNFHNLIFYIKKKRIYYNITRI